jgi:hypothetical protein
MFHNTNNVLLSLVIGTAVVLEGVQGFAPHSGFAATSTHSRRNTARFVAVDPTMVLPNGAVTEEPTAWDCVEVPACDEQVCRTSLDVRIHGNWYDLSGKQFLHMCCLLRDISIVLHSTVSSHSNTIISLCYDNSNAMLYTIYYNFLMCI